MKHCLLHRVALMDPMGHGRVNGVTPYPSDSYLTQWVRGYPYRANSMGAIRSAGIVESDLIIWISQVITTFRAAFMALRADFLLARRGRTSPVAAPRMEKNTVDFLVVSLSRAFALTVSTLTHRHCDTTSTIRISPHRSDRHRRWPHGIRCGPQFGSIPQSVPRSCSSSILPFYITSPNGLRPQLSQTTNPLQSRAKCPPHGHIYTIPQRCILTAFTQRIANSSRHHLDGSRTRR